MKRSFGLGRKEVLALGVVLGVSFLAVAFHDFISGRNRGVRKGGIEVFNPRVQASRFIAFYRSIPLTPEQEKIKEEALSGISAPCCNDNSIATCCCPCNLVKSVWGLSHFLIAKRGYDAREVREAVERWIHLTNGRGYSGRACYQGRCGQPFERDGCGGMNERRIS